MKDRYYELSESPKPIRYELTASQDSAGHTMIQDLNARNKFAIFVSTGFLRESWPTVDTPGDEHSVETAICASPLQKFTGLGPIAATDAYFRKPANLGYYGRLQSSR